MVGDSNMTMDEATRKMFGKVAGAAAGDFAADKTTVVEGAVGALPERILYIPLQFWFNRIPSLALPLVALQFHQTRLTFNFAPVSALHGYFTDTSVLTTISVGGITLGAAASQKHGILSTSAFAGVPKIRLFGTYIYLSGE